MEVVEEKELASSAVDSLRVRWAREGTLCLKGELDLATAPVLEDILDGALDGDRDLVVDLSALTFMDAAGLRAFAKAASGLRGRAKMVLRSPSGVVRRVLELSDMTRTAHIEVMCP